MESDIAYYQQRIKECLEASGRYTRALDLNILVLASSLRRLSIAINETEALAAETVSVKSPNGALQQHPAFKAQREAEETILRQLKELGLTADGTRQNVERDPTADLLAEVIGSKRTKIVKPDDR